jgi:integral membrane protein (TIGR01906 family)
VTRRWETAVAAAGLAVSGLVALAIGFGGTATYESIMRDHRPATFHVVAGDAVRRTLTVDLASLTGWHNLWFAYVTGDSDRPPAAFGASVFTSAEYAHMADVRNVFVSARIAAIAAALIAALVILFVSRRGRLAAVVVVRDAATAASVGSAIVAVTAALAFDPLFLLFHEVFFPQGNFLFPSDSNLLALYPDPYWYGVTLRVGLTFVAAMAVIAVASAATLRQARR